MRCSRGFAVFKKQPTADEVIAFMTKAVNMVESAPRHLISECGAVQNHEVSNNALALLASTEVSPLLKD